MGSVFTKRTLMIVALSAVAVGFLRKQAAKDKTSAIGKIADTLGLA